MTSLFLYRLAVSAGDAALAEPLPECSPVPNLDPGVTGGGISDVGCGSGFTGGSDVVPDEAGLDEVGSLLDEDVGCDVESPMGAVVVADGCDVGGPEGSAGPTLGLGVVLGAVLVGVGAPFVGRSSEPPSELHATIQVNANGEIRPKQIRRLTVMSVLCPKLP